MGYIHDARMTLWLPPELAGASDALAAWAVYDDGAAWSLQRPAAGAGTWTLRLPLAPPGNSLPARGARPLCLDLWYSVSGAALSDCAAHLERSTLPANGVGWSAPQAVAFTYDAAHDSSSERSAAGSHRVALTISEPDWIAAGEVWQARFSGAAALSSVVRFYGAVLSYTLRL